MDSEKVLSEGLMLFQQKLITENDYNELKKMVLDNLAKKFESASKRGPGRPKYSLNKKTILKMKAEEVEVIEEEVEVIEEDAEEEGEEEGEKEVEEMDLDTNHLVESIVDLDKNHFTFQSPDLSIFDSTFS